MTDRLKRIDALLLREIASALYAVIDDGDFDHAAVTVIRVEAARNLRQARVWVSIRADDARQAVMLGILRAHRGAIQHAINRDLTIKFTPRLEFVADRSIAQGAHVLEILNAIEAELPPEESPSDAEPPNPL